MKNKRIGGAVGALLGILLILAVVYFFMREEQSQYDFGQNVNILLTADKVNVSAGQPVKVKVQVIGDAKSWYAPVFAGRVFYALDNQFYQNVLGYSDILSRNQIRQIFINQFEINTSELESGEHTFTAIVIQADLRDLSDLCSPNYPKGYCWIDQASILANGKGGEDAYNAMISHEFVGEVDRESISFLVSNLEQPEKKTNWLLYVGVAGGIALLLILSAIIFRRK